MKPVALLVQARTGSEDLHLREEVTSIRRSLREAGFEAMILKSPTLAQVKQVLSSPRFRDRVCIFHYAGHANGDGVFLKGSAGDRIAYMRGFAKLLKHQVALRLVFMNGCLTEDHQQHFQNFGPDLTLLVTKADIHDDVATEFAKTFYDALRARDVGRAFDEAEGALQADHELPREVMRSHADVVEAIPENASGLESGSGLESESAGPSGAWPWMISGSRDFRLSDGFEAVLPFSRSDGRHVRVGWLSAYVAALAIIVVLFAFLSHVAKSSPAFQAEFSYGLTSSEIDKRLEENLAPTSTTDPVPNRLTDDVLVFKPGGTVFGFVVESIRGLVILGILFFTAGFIYNERLRSESPIGSRGWLVNPFNLSYILLAILVFCLVIFYHIQVAPRKLERGDGIWNKTGVLEEDRAWEARRDRTVWANAGSGWLDDATVASFFDLRGDDPGRMRTAIWKRVYLHPYLWYLPYSIANYVFAGVPLLFVMVKGTLNSYRKVDLYLTAMPAILRKSSDEETTVGLLKQTFLKISGEMERYLFLMLLILIAALFESRYGYLTLASVAVLVAIFAMFLFVLGAVVVGVTLVRYHKECSNIEAHLSESPSPALTEALEKHSVVDLLRRPLTAALISLDVAAFGTFAGWALNLIGP